MRIAVYGNLTIDEIVARAGIVRGPGGSALYASAASAFLGARVTLFSSVGPDYPTTTFQWLTKHGVDPTRVRRTNSPSTRFRIAYKDGSRQLKLLSRGSRLKAEDSKSRFDAIHLGPVFGELDKQIAIQAREKSRMISLDIQGLVRRVRRNGSVQLVHRRLSSLLECCDVVKASDKELRVSTKAQDPVTGARKIVEQGPGVAIVTLGKSGVVLSLKGGQIFHVRSYPEPSILDSTGAGDILAGAWLSTYVSTKDPVWATCVGSAFSSLSLKRFGVSKFRISRRELFHRSAWVYKRVKPIQG